MSTGKKIMIALFIGMFIPPISVLCATWFITLGMWYLAILGLRTKIRNYKHERILRHEYRRRKSNREEPIVDGGVIYPENFHRDDLKISQYR